MGARIPLITDRHGLEGDGRAAFDAIVESRGSMLRPFEVLLHAPPFARAVAALGHEIRFGSALLDADRELVTLATGRARGCAFVWDSHLEAARAAGIGADVLSALEGDPELLAPPERTLVAFVDELCATGTVSEGTFGAVHELLGTRGVVELSVVIGYYTMLGSVMSVTGACSDDG